jgi:hypothetical protein
MIQQALQPNVLGGLGLALLAGLATGLWLGRHRRPAAVVGVLMGLCAAAATAVPPQFIPTAEGPGFTSQTESLFVLVVGMLGLSVGVTSWRLQLRSWSIIVAVLMLQLVSFGLGVWSVQLSLPPHLGG